jgi:penicillin-binding protein
MASAFSTIANYGLRTENYLVERIEDSDGNVVYQHEIRPPRSSLLDPPCRAPWRR